MYTHKLYIVACTKNLRDVHVENIYDGSVFTLDTIVYGYKKKLKDKNIYVSVLGDNAYIDIVDESNELIKTISILSKQVLLKKEID